jgi:hypothetical protein
MTTGTPRTQAAEVTVAAGDRTFTTPAEAPRCGGVGPSSHRQRLMCKPQPAAKHISKAIRTPVAVTAYRYSVLVVSGLMSVQHHRVTRYS